MRVYKDNGDTVIQLTPREKSNLHDILFNYQSLTEDKLYLSNTKEFADDLRMMISLKLGDDKNG